MKYALWLANIPGIGNQKIRYLLQECQNAQEIYYLEERYFEKIYGIDASVRTEDFLRRMLERYGY